MKRLLVGLLSGVTLVGALTGVSFAISNKDAVVADAATSSWDGSSRTAYTSAALNYNGAAYYPIRTAAELAYLATDSSSWNKNFILMNDIDLASKSWTPIALTADSTTKDSENTRIYSGVFDGNGHSIANLSLSGSYDNSSSASVRRSNVGFFSDVSGTVKNLSLRNSNVDISGNIGGLRVGALVGYNRGTITNVSILQTTVKGNGTYKTGSYATASVCGDSFGSLVGLNEGTVKNSLAITGSVYATSANHWSMVGRLPYSSDVHAGRLIGYENGGTSTSNTYADISISVGYATIDGKSGSLDSLASAITAINGPVSAKSTYTSGGIYDNNLTPFVVGTGLAAQNNAATAEETNAAFLALKTCDPTNAYSEALAFQTQYQSDTYLQDVANNTTYTKDDNGNDVTAYTSVTKMNYMLSKYAPSKYSGMGLFSNPNETSSFATVIVVLSLSLLLAAPFLYKHLKRQ